MLQPRKSLLSRSTPRTHRFVKIVAPARTRTPKRQWTSHICKQAAADQPFVPPTSTGPSSPLTTSPSPSASPTPTQEDKQPETAPKRNLWQQIKYFFFGEKLDKERLAALGMGAFASYGVISNINYCTCATIAWLSFIKTTGTSPLAEGQWPAFLAFYAGIWAMQNFLRPLRFSLALALAPVFNTAIEKIAEKTGLEKKWAFGILLVGIAITTISTWATVLYLLGGFSV